MKFSILIAIVLFSSNLFAQICPSLHHWVKPHHRSDYYRFDGTYVSASYVAGHCRANQKSFENWGQSFVSGMPKGWPHKEKSKGWQEAEKELILVTLDRVPDFLVKIKNIQLFRSESSVTKGNHGTSSESIIFLYDSAFKDEKLLLRVLTHELAHQAFLRSSPFDVVSIGSALGWQYKDGAWVKTKKAILLQDDSYISLEEAYANAVELYVADPFRLKSRASSIYEWIKIEYGDKIK